MVLWRSHSSLRGIVAWPAFVWMGMLLILGLVLASADVVRLIVHAGGGARDPERRLFLRRALSAGAAAVAAGLGAVAVWRGHAARARARRRGARCARLPRALDGFTIVQLTDVHVGGRRSHARSSRTIVATTNALAPDVVAITGDLVDGSVARAARRTWRRSPSCRRGTASSSSPATTSTTRASTSGWRSCRRSASASCATSASRIGDGGATFDLAGVDDWSAAARCRATARICRARSPGATRRARWCCSRTSRARSTRRRAHGVGLQLSGHTHGGQIWPWSCVVRLQQPYVAGLARLRGHADLRRAAAPATGARRCAWARLPRSRASRCARAGVVRRRS